jgi:hypothetical protein
MRDEYDFSKARKNPYATQLKKSITIRLDEELVDYFKAISEEIGIPYQTLINLYLRDCASARHIDGCESRTEQYKMPPMLASSLVRGNETAGGVQVVSDSD